MRGAILAVAIVLTVPYLAYGHPGGLDANGGHYNRRTGGYHYHGGGGGGGGSLGQSSAAEERAPRTTSRRRARTSARTTSRRDAPAHDALPDDDTPQRLVDQEEPRRRRQVTQDEELDTKLEAKYRMYFTKGKRKLEIADFQEEDDAYAIVGLNGGRGRYEKSLIDRIEHIKTGEIVAGAPADD
jgi:hypothetical protein